MRSGGKTGARSRARAIAGLGLAVLLAVLVTACGDDEQGSAAGSGGAKDSITLAVAVKAPDPGQVFIYAPEGGGFFAKEGLDVEPLFNDGGQAALQQVASGKADFGLSSAENLMNGIAAGFPLKAFAMVMTSTIYRNGVGVLDSSPITSYDQLKGKSIGVSSFTSGSYPFAQGAIAEAGLDPKEDVKFSIIGNGGPAADALEKGHVDGAVTTETQWATIQSLGVKVRFLEPKPEAGSLPADVLVTRPEVLEKDPDLAVRVARAVMEGTVAALDKPENALKWYEDEFATAAKAAPPATNQAIIDARLDSMRQVPDQQGKWGYIPIHQYERIQELGVQYGVIEKPVDVPAVFTNDLVDQINEFDEEAVKASAAGGK
jgi:NitT/TauT family transport system substrate-binding protein